MIATISVLQLNGSMNKSYTSLDEHTRFLTKLKPSGWSELPSTADTALNWLLTSLVCDLRFDWSEVVRF